MFKSVGIRRVSYYSTVSRCGYFDDELPTLKCVVSGLWPHFCPALGVQLKVGLVHKHPSRLGNVLFTKRCVHLSKVIVSRAVAALAVSLS